MLSRLLALPLAHWRGDLPLIPSLLISLLGLRWLIAAMGGIPLFALDAGVLLWQVTGCLRAMHRHMRDRPGFWVYAATLGSVIAALVMMAYPYFPHEARRLSDMPSEPPPETGLHLTPEGARLEGPISHDMYKALLAALPDLRDHNVLTLSSNGGNVFAARGIARLVREHPLAVRVEDSCASACTLIFIAARDRRLGPHGRLGFHGYRLTSPTPLFDPEREEARDRSDLLARGVDADFIARIFQTAPDDIWFPDRSELIAAGIIDQ